MQDPQQNDDQWFEINPKYCATLMAVREHLRDEDVINVLSFLLQKDGSCIQRSRKEMTDMYSKIHWLSQSSKDRYIFIQNHVNEAIDCLLLLRYVRPCEAPKQDTAETPSL